MLELEHGFRVVDVHARLEPDERRGTGREISPERLERELHQAGVVRAVVSPGAQRVAGSYLRPNNAVARMSVDRPFLAFARINGPRDPERPGRPFATSKSSHGRPHVPGRHRAVRIRRPVLRLRTPSADRRAADEDVLADRAVSLTFPSSSEPFRHQLLVVSLLTSRLCSLNGVFEVHCLRAVLASGVEVICSATPRGPRPRAMEQALLERPTRSRRESALLRRPPERGRDGDSENGRSRRRDAKGVLEQSQPRH